MGFARWIAVVAGLGVGSLSGVGCEDKMVTPPSSGASVVADAGEGVVLQEDAGEFGVGNGPPGVVTLDDAAVAIDPSAVYSVTLTTDTFTVPPNQEVYKCQDFANPFQGQAVDITRYDLSMTTGSHHMLLLYSQGATNGPLIDCPQGGLQFGNYTFGAQSEKASQTYPDGVGASIPTGMGFTVDAHYVNTGATALQGAVKITMFVARPGLVTQHAGVLSFILTSISIPATGQPVTATGTCPIGQAANVLWTGAHMHQRATHFIATSGATTLYETNIWSEPPSQTFSPPLQLAADSSVTWACTYVNDTGSTLTFGPSALTNVMCNFSAAFYPVQDPSNPVVSCMQ
jgi:hypothetical protein